MYSLAEEALRGSFDRGPWVSRGDRPTAAGNYRQTAACGSVVDGCLHICGSRDSVDHSVYDPVTNTWTSKANTPQARNYAGAVEYNGLIYLVGGWYGSSAILSTYSWNPGSNLWTQLADLPTGGRSLAGVAAAAGFVFMFCGHTGTTVSGRVNTTLRYNISSNTWTSDGAVFHTVGLHGVFAATSPYDGLVYVGGGDDGSDELAIWKACDPVSNTMTAKTSFPESGRESAFIGAYNRLIDVIGGAGSGAGSTNEHYRFDVGTNTWVILPVASSNVSAGPGGYVNGYMIYCEASATLGEKATFTYKIQTEMEEKLALLADLIAALT